MCACCGRSPSSFGLKISIWNFAASAQTKFTLNHVKDETHCKYCPRGGLLRTFQNIVFQVTFTISVEHGEFFR